MAISEILNPGGVDLRDPETGVTDGALDLSWVVPGGAVEGTCVRVDRLHDPGQPGADPGTGPHQAEERVLAFRSRRIFQDPSVVIDGEAPVLQLPDDITAECANNGAANVDFTVTATDNVDADPTVECDVASGSSFPVGDTVVTCTATDFNGNVSDPESFTVTVADSADPSIVCPNDIEVNCVDGDGAIVDFQAFPSDLCDDNLQVWFSPIGPGEMFPLGTTEVTATATDAGGNTASCTFNVTVSGDSTGPDLTCSGDIIATCTDSNGAAVEFTAPTVSDDCDANPTVECDANSGDTFPVGDTTVTCTATDATGNSSECSFTITVDCDGFQIPGDANQDGTVDMSDAITHLHIVILGAAAPCSSMDANTALLDFDGVDGAGLYGTTVAALNDALALLNWAFNGTAGTHSARIAC